MREGKKCLLFLNRRGRWRALVCGECGLRVTCPLCHVGLSLHGSSRSSRVECHHCGYTSAVPEKCAGCGGHKLRGVGIAIEEAIESLERLFPKAQIARYDSESEKILKGKDPWQADIVVATSLGTHLDHGELALVGFLLIESDLAVARYDMEERVYLRARAAMQNGREVIIQSYRPDSAFIEILISGNYRDFVKYTLGERKKWGYPPYGEIATIWIYHRSKERVDEVSIRLKNKLNELAPEGTLVAFERAEVTRRGDLTMRSMLIKGGNVRELLEKIRGELTRNSGVAVEWG